MRHRVFFLEVALVGALALSPSAAFSQAQTTSSRIPQQIVINGQMSTGAYVMGAGAQFQSFSCPSPQKYSTADGSSQGWACYEQTNGVWLLNALPPAPVPQAVPAAPLPVTISPVSSQQSFVTFPRSSTSVIYPSPPTVFYQQPAIVIYPQRAPVVYAPPPFVVGPAYPSSVILGRVAIEAAGRIASAAFLNSHYPRGYINFNTYEIGRDRGRYYGRHYGRRR